MLKYSRITERLKKSILAIAFNTSARGATKICEIIFSKFSKDTIIRLLMKIKLNVVTDYKFIGGDDWAYRKSSSYGIIICDTLPHKPIELLSDRSTKTLSDWIKLHSNISIVTRDRANAYSKAIDENSSALQIADKWHLLRNISDLIKTILDDNYPKGLYVNKDIETTTIIGEISPAESKTVSENLTSAARKKLH